LKSNLARVAAVAVAALLAGGACANAGMTAATPSAKPPAQAAPAHAAVKPPARVIPIDALDRSIGRELRKPEFAWRLPRQDEDNKSEGFLGAILAWIRSGVEWVGHIIGVIWKAVRDWFFKTLPAGSHDVSTGGMPPIEAIVYAVLGILAIVLAWFGWQAWKNRRQVTPAESVPTAIPDLQAEDVQADQLPEDGWLALVRELMEKGEFRLALRAAYLAGLAHLGNRDLLALARHKSNLDYWRELRRRARTQADLLAAFEENLQVFERAWYGRSQVTADVLTHFTGNLERIRAC
jgi:hypothetical protein